MRASEIVADKVTRLVPFNAGPLTGTSAPLELSAISPASGTLSGIDLDTWREDWPTLVYVVYAYGTPFAWHTEDGRWHIAMRKTTRNDGGSVYDLIRKAVAES
jgi:hypothetical protein